MEELIFRNLRTPKTYRNSVPREKAWVICFIRFCGMSHTVWAGHSVTQGKDNIDRYKGKQNFGL